MIPARSVISVIAGDFSRSNGDVHMKLEDLKEPKEALQIAIKP